MKTSANGRLNFHTCLAIWCGFSLAAAVGAETPAAPEATSNPIATKAATYLSSSLQDVVKLTKAGVPDSVVLNYVQSSQKAYAVDAQDIIQLRAEGVSPEVTTALIQQGEALRKADAAKAAAATATAATTAPVVVAQPPVVVTTPEITYVPTPVYPRSSVSVTYIGYPSYSYSGYYCGYRYPSYSSWGPRYYSFSTPRVHVGFGGRRGPVAFGRRH